MAERRVRHLLRVATLIIGVVGAACGEPERQTEVASESPPWANVASPPVSPRGPGELSWTGKHLVLVGGEEHTDGKLLPSGDGAIYDPETGEWSELPAMPITPAPYGLASAWTGREVVVVGQPCVVDDRAEDLECAPSALEAAALDPVAREWRTLELPEQLGRKRDSFAPTALSGYDGVAFFAVPGATLGGPPDLWSWDGSAWSKLPSPPVVSPRFCAAAAGSLVAVSSLDEATLSSTGAPGTAGRAQVAAVLSYNNGQPSWSAPIANDAATRRPVVANVFCAGSTVVVVPDRGATPQSGLARFDAGSKSWVPASPPPRDLEVPAKPPRAATGVVLLADIGLVYDSNADEWRSVEVPNGELLNSGVDVEAGVVFQRFDPASQRLVLQFVEVGL